MLHLRILPQTVSKASDVYAFSMSAYEVNPFSTYHPLMTLMLSKVFTSTLPWGVLSEKHIYQLVVYEDSRPDRPDPILEARVGLSDDIWGIIDEAWHHEARLRPSFDIIVRLWQNLGASLNNVVSPRPRSTTLPPLSPTLDIGHNVSKSVSGKDGSLARSPTAYSVRSFTSIPPAYDAPLSSPKVVPPTRAVSYNAAFANRLEPPTIVKDGGFRSTSPESQLSRRLPDPPLNSSQLLPSPSSLTSPSRHSFTTLRPRSSCTSIPPVLFLLF